MAQNRTNANSGQVTPAPLHARPAYRQAATMGTPANTHHPSSEISGLPPNGPTPKTIPSVFHRTVNPLPQTPQTPLQQVAVNSSVTYPDFSQSTQSFTSIPPPPQDAARNAGLEWLTSLPESTRATLVRISLTRLVGERGRGEVTATKKGRLSS